jgi:hypothetical protein
MVIGQCESVFGFNFYLYNVCFLFAFPVEHLSRLKGDTSHSRQHAYAEGTRKNVAIQWRAFFLFCSYFELVALPVSLDTICMYAQFLSRSFKSVQSIQNYVNGVKLLHLLHDAQFPQISRPEFKLLMRGLARLNPHVPRQALPITQVILLEFHVTVWCILLFCFFLLARKSCGYVGL